MICIPLAYYLHAYAFGQIIYTALGMQLENATFTIDLISLTGWLK